MPAAYTNISTSTAAVTNRFVTSTNMANGAYALANTTPPWAQGGCRLVATITGVTGNDTPGTITIVGTGLNSATITEVLTLTAGGSATSANAFRSITSITQAGWVINGGNDTIVIGAEAGAIVVGSVGTLYAIVVNTTQAAAVVVADQARTIATLKASIAEGHYLYGDIGVDFAGFLRVSTTSTNDLTIIHSPTLPNAIAV